MHSLEVGRKFDEYTGVVIHAGMDDSGEEITFSSGDSSGYVLEVDNPIGNQTMANSILSSLRLRGARYQPFEAGNAPIDPATEPGDSVSVNGTDAIIMAIRTDHSTLMSADISAPFDEEVDHEFKYEPKLTREFKREAKQSRARLTINAEAILAEVTRAQNEESRIEQRFDSITLSVTGRNGSSTFVITDGTTELFSDTFDLQVKSVNISGKLTANQIEVNDLSAFGATIGGWNISQTSLFKTISDQAQVFIQAPRNPSIYSDAIIIQTKADGAWHTKFSVTYGGKLYATGAEITGKITATEGTIGGVTIRDGKLYGIKDENIEVGGISGGWGGSLAGGSVTGWNVGGSTLETGNMVAGINTNLGFGAAYGAAAVQGSGAPAAYFTTNGLTVNSNYMGFRHNGVSKTLQVITKTIGGETINYLGYL